VGKFKFKYMLKTEKIKKEIDILPNNTTIISTAFQKEMSGIFLDMPALIFDEHFRQAGYKTPFITTQEVQV
jgi:hypothetical protein